MLRVERYQPNPEKKKHKKVNVGNDQETVQSERNSHSKDRNGEKLN